MIATPALRAKFEAIIERELQTQHRLAQIRAAAVEKLASYIDDNAPKTKDDHAEARVLIQFTSRRPTAIRAFEQALRIRAKHEAHEAHEAQATNLGEPSLDDVNQALQFLAASMEQHQSADEDLSESGGVTDLEHASAPESSGVAPVMMSDSA